MVDILHSNIVKEKHNFLDVTLHKLLQRFYISVGIALRKIYLRGRKNMKGKTKNVLWNENVRTSNWKFFETLIIEWSYICDGFSISARNSHLASPQDENVSLHMLLPQSLRLCYAVGFVSSHCTLDKNICSNFWNHKNSKKFQSWN